MRPAGLPRTIAVSTMFVLAAMAVSEACPLEREDGGGMSWWSRWHAWPVLRVETPTANVAITKLTADGALDTPVVRRVLRRAELAACWDGTSGDVTVVFRVTADGETTNVSARGVAAACVARAVDAVVVPTRTDGDTFVHVTIALTAHP